MPRRTVTRSRSDAERADRVARLAAGLAVLGLTVDMLSNLTLHATWLRLGAISVCGAGWLWLHVSRRAPSLVRANLVFLVVNAAIILALAQSSQRLAALDIPWVPFRPNQLGALTVALLAPPTLWVGLVTIVGFVGAAVLQFALFEPSIRENIAYGDPWATLAFGGFAVAILIYRLRATHIEREAALAHVRAASFERLARAMVALRDLSNTPLQTVSNSVELLRMRHPSERELADRLERALRHLVELEELARPYERHLQWQAEDVSWDPKTILRAIAEHEPRTE